MPSKKRSCNKWQWTLDVDLKWDGHLLTCCFKYWLVKIKEEIFATLSSFPSPSCKSLAGQKFSGSLEGPSRTNHHVGHRKQYLANVRLQL